MLEANESAMSDEKTTRLVQEISNLELVCKKHASRNHDYAYATAILAVIGSIAATILASIDGIPKPLVAITAIIPAAVAAITNILRFEPKSQWFYERLHNLSALRRALEFEDADRKEVSNKLSILEQEYQNRWVKFGENSGKTEAKAFNKKNQTDA